MPGPPTPSGSCARRRRTRRSRCSPSRSSRAHLPEFDRRPRDRRGAADAREPASGRRARRGGAGGSRERASTLSSRRPCTSSRSRRWRNAQKHAPGATLTVSLRSAGAGRRLVVEVHDDGPGFDPRGVTRGPGLRTCTTGSPRRAARSPPTAGPAPGRGSAPRCRSRRGCCAFRARRATRAGRSGRPRHGGSARSRAGGGASRRSTRCASRPSRPTGRARQRSACSRAPRHQPQHVKLGRRQLHERRPGLARALSEQLLDDSWVEHRAAGRHLTDRTHKLLDVSDAHLVEVAVSLDSMLQQRRRAHRGAAVIAGAAASRS